MSSATANEVVAPAPTDEPRNAKPESSSLDDAIDRRVLLHMPVDVRSASLAFLALAASIALLRWTEDFIVPVLLGVVLSYALTPVIDRLEGIRVPRMVGAGLVMALLLGIFFGTGYALRGQADEFLTSMPQLVTKIQQTITGKSSDRPSAIARVQIAAKAIESAASGQGPVGDGTDAGPSAGRPASRAPLVENADISLRGYVVSGTLGVLAFVGQALVVIFVALFLLSTGNTFRRKMVTLAGPTLSQRRITLQALDEVHRQIQRYLLVQLATSVLVGIATGVAFFAIGLHNAAIWGVVAGVSNLIPYVGSVAISGVSGVAGLVQSGDVDFGLLLAAASFAIHVVVGNLVTPWLTGRTSKMSPFVVFVAVLFFGWLWGVAGLILAFPILVAVKIVCERVDDLKPISELLGG